MPVRRAGRRGSPPRRAGETVLALAAAVVLAGAGSGSAVAPPPDAAAGEDSLGGAVADTQALADSIAGPPALPDTVWAVHVATFATLDSALALRRQLAEGDHGAFAHIRALPDRYWYEVFAGPVAEADEAARLGRQLGTEPLVQFVELLRASRDLLLAGLVGEPVSGPPAALEAPTPPQPRLIQLAEPVYPEVAFDAGVTGTVVVNVLVGETGEVLEVQILQSAHLLLDDAALTAARQSLYAPALEDGKPVTAWLSLPFEFELP